MIIKKSVPYYGKSFLSRIRIPSLNNNINQGVIKRDGNPIPQIRKNETVIRKPNRQNSKGREKHRSPVTNRKRSSQASRQKKWYQRLDSKLNELKWLDEEG
ncbi:hypothetical protein AB6A23_18220 [Paenibacillus tarimensis]